MIRKAGRSRTPNGRGLRSEIGGCKETLVVNQREGEREGNCSSCERVKKNNKTENQKNKKEVSPWHQCQKRGQAFKTGVERNRMAGPSVKRAPEGLSERAPEPVKKWSHLPSPDGKDPGDSTKKWGRPGLKEPKSRQGGLGCHHVGRNRKKKSGGGQGAKTKKKVKGV